MKRIITTIAFIMLSLQAAQYVQAIKKMDYLQHTIFYDVLMNAKK